MLQCLFFNELRNISFVLAMVLFGLLRKVMSFRISEDVVRIPFNLLLSVSLDLPFLKAEEYGVQETKSSNNTLHTS